MVIDAVGATVAVAGAMVAVSLMPVVVLQMPVVAAGAMVQVPGATVAGDVALRIGKTTSHPSRDEASTPSALVGFVIEPSIDGPVLPFRTFGYLK